jgi:hypothetical protein
MKRTAFLIILLFCLSLVLGAGGGIAQEDHPQEVSAAAGSGFTYQGRLKGADGSPLSATCSFRFSLWDAPSGGAQVGADSLVSGVSLADGYFIALVNGGGEFGTSAFQGEAHWLGVAVKCGDDPGYTSLSPRQPLTPCMVQKFYLQAETGAGGCLK